MRAPIAIDMGLAGIFCTSRYSDVSKRASLFVAKDRLFLKVRIKAKVDCESKAPVRYKKSVISAPSIIANKDARKSEFTKGDL